MKTFFALFALSANIAFAADMLSLPTGAKVEKYKYDFIPNTDPATLSVCGLHTALSNEAVLANLELLYNSGPFYQYLKVKQSIELKLQNVQVHAHQGTDCNYQGFSGSDPDWNCDEEVQGHWVRVGLSFSDKFGNVWKSGHQSEIVSDARQLPSNEESRAQALDELKRIQSYCAQE